jgi:hypothetical protein
MINLAKRKFKHYLVLNPIFMDEDTNFKKVWESRNKNNSVRSITIYDFKTYYRVITTKTA